jgi:large subunit ribosomal protein L35
MPKMKSHSGAGKRFKKSGSGKVIRGQANASHYLEGKSGTRRRRLQRETQVSKSDSKRVRKMLGS